MIIKDKLTKLLNNKKVNYCHVCKFLKVKKPKEAVCQLKDEEFTFLPSCIPHSEHQLSLVWREHEKQINFLSKAVVKEISTGEKNRGKLIFIAGVRIDLEEKETVWKRLQKKYRFLEKQINVFIGQISREMNFLENAREEIYK